jgi:hypothetical protein
MILMKKRRYHYKNTDEDIIIHDNDDNDNVDNDNVDNDIMILLFL